MLKYKINLVKKIRDAQRRGEAHAKTVVFMIIVCVCVLFAAAFHTYEQINAMQKIIETEKEEIARMQNEIRKLEQEQTTISINKADIELLDSLQSRRIYWTQVLNAMARHLPHEQPTSYWITKFGYRAQPQTYTVRGYGYITEKQEQLLSLDEYLQNLRSDENWSEVFGTTSLRSAQRSDEFAGRARSERVSFEYVSTKRGAARR